MNKVLVLHADIGAAKNIAKNLCLLDESIHFPINLHGESRLNFLLRKLYPTNYSDWFKCEYVLKDYTKYGIEMDIGDVRSGGIVPLNQKLVDVLEHKHFILDLMDHGTAINLDHSHYCSVLGIMPYTTLGLNWQIRAYTMKYGAGRMFNFTFPDEDTIERFKQQYGTDTWVDVNLTNFYDMVRRRRNILRQSDIKNIPLECIIWPHRWEELFTHLETAFDITIPRDQAMTLISQWFSLHWPTETTNDWEYNRIFLPNRHKTVTDNLHLCENFK
jgi:hypothetical protein